MPKSKTRKRLSSGGVLLKSKDYKGSSDDAESSKNASNTNKPLLQSASKIPRLNFNAAPCLNPFQKTNFNTTQNHRPLLYPNQNFNLPTNNQPLRIPPIPCFNQIQMPIIPPPVQNLNNFHNVSHFRQMDESGALERLNQKLDMLIIENRSKNSPVIKNLNFEEKSSTEISTLFPPPVSTPIAISNPDKSKNIQSGSPIGVFWDIENCSVPKGKSALFAVNKIRDRFFKNFLEAEFICVCDIRKESPQIIQELNDAQCSVVHVAGNSKNAADDKLRQAMRRYADIYSPLSGYSNNSASFLSSTKSTPAILLISGDINFATELSDLRHRKKLYVILLHNKHASEALLLCANEHYDFHTFLDDIPNRPYLNNLETSHGIPLKGGYNTMDLLVSGLPLTKNPTHVKNRLKKLSDNCGGKVINIQGQFATLRFPNKEAALRASKRMNGEDVFGSKIHVIYSSNMGFTQQQGQGGAPQQQHQELPQLINPLPIKPHNNCSGPSVWNNAHHGRRVVQQVSPTRSTNSNSSPPSSSSENNESSAVGTTTTSIGKGFDLHITNIDPCLGDWKSIRSALHSIFSEHVTVRGVWVYMGSGSSETNGVSGVVRVETKEEAHLAIAQLHRRKIGSKRIFISFESGGGSVDYGTLKREVAALLQDVPHHSLPLFKFREMFEKRYRRSVSSSDLYKMKDVVGVTETSGSSSSGSSVGSGRIISLSHEWRAKSDDSVGVYCPEHPPLKKSSDKNKIGWAERETGLTLPSVVMNFKVLKSNIGQLLESHGGSFPLISFLDCYESEFGKIDKVEEGRGVPLEHLIASVQDVEIGFGENGMKRVQWKTLKEQESGLMQQPLGAQLCQLSRELIDLLKTFPRTSIPFSKLIPAYHHHFGRQCRVADYGHTTLLSLLSTLPNTIQIIGEGTTRIITLAHRAQMKRFATDVLRVLKAVPGTRKIMSLKEFPSAYEQLFLTRDFAPEDYGLCHFIDLVHELVENFLLVSLTTADDGTQFLTIPKREQTLQEAQKTRLFTSDVIELLSNSIRCELPFSKFIPSYHHHFGKQCRVSDFGFSKLAELFEAICDVVVLSGTESAGGEMSGGEERLIVLSPQVMIQVVGTQLRKLVRKRGECGLGTRVRELEELYVNEHGFSLRLDLCGVKDLNELLTKHLHPFVTVEGERVVGVESGKEGDEGRDYGGAGVETELSSLILSSSSSSSSDERNGESSEKKTALQTFGEEIEEILLDAGGYLAVQNIENAYYQKYGKQLVPSKFGCPSLLTLLQTIPDVATLRGKFRTKRILVLNRHSRPPLFKSASGTHQSHYNSHQAHHGTTPNNANSNNSNNNKGGSKGLASSHSGPTLGSFRVNNNNNGSSEPTTPVRWANMSNISNSGNNGSYGGTTNGYGSRLSQLSGVQQGGSHQTQLQAQQNNLFHQHAQMVQSPIYGTRGGDSSNIFNFEQPQQLSPPVYDMWMAENGNQGTPPVSPPFVWYHPICYQNPATPGSPNVLIPNYSYGTWNTGSQQLIGYDHLQPSK